MEVTKSPADSPDLEEATLPAPPGGPSGTASAKEGESNTPQLHFGQHFLHVWYGLPSAAKATLLLAVVSTLLLMAYAIVGLTDSGQEEDHIAAVIIIMAVFNMYAVSDAVIFENTLQLLSSLVLSSLMLARVLWFIGTKQSTTDSMLPVVDTLGALNSAVVLALIVAAAVSARQFGWRLYSRLNVDHRNKGAESLQRLALVADAFNTLVKVDMAFIVTLIAVGLDAALEKQTQPQYSVIALSIIILVLCTSVAVLGMIIAFKNVSKSKGICMLRVFDMLAPLSCGGPIALMVVYHVTVVDAAKAWTTIVIACCVVIATTLSLWAILHVLLRSTSKLMFMGGGVTLKSTSMSPGYRHDSAVLAPLRKGEWLGKPSHRNPRKIRFFQLSHDETTLRWGWKHFVRLYYVQDLTRDYEMLTITLTFVMDKELTLRFPDKKMLSLWYDGLQHVSAKLLTPSVPEKDDGEDNTVDKGPHGWKFPSMDPKDEFKGDDRLPTKKVASRFGEVGAILTAAANAVGWRQDKADGRGAAKKTFSISSPRAERNHHFTVTVATQTEDEDFAESSSQKSFQGAPTNEAELADQYAALMELAQSSEGRKVEPGSVGTEVAIKVNHDNHRNGEDYFKKGIESSQEQQQYFDEVKVNSKSLTMSVDTIDYRNLQLGQLLGSGAEGTVHAAWYLDTPVALKRFNRLEDSLHELGMYLGLGSHDNIVALRALCNREDNVDLVLEYCPR